TANPTSAPAVETVVQPSEAPPINGALKIEQERKAKESYYQFVEIKTMNDSEKEMVQIFRDAFSQVRRAR
ncbi:MAG: hypothetical protein ACKPKO_02820, partial [Candidatus Fonsibacter sp.]